jgi:hypothetical protein
MFTKEFKLAAVQRLEQGISLGEVVGSGNWICLNSHGFFTARQVLAIMNQRDAEDPGSIPVRADRRRRVDEPTPIAGH